MAPAGPLWYIQGIAWPVRRWCSRVYSHVGGKMSCFRCWRSLTAVFPFLALMALSGAMAQQGRPHDPEAVQELLARTDGRAQVGLNRATGTVSFLRLEPGDLRLAGRDRAERTAHFFQRHGRALGIRDAASELSYAGERGDALGHHRRTYLQRYRAKSMQ